LQDSLGGNAKTMIIANVSPSAICCSETISTLSFALRAKSMRNNAKINVDTQVGWGGWRLLAGSLAGWLAGWLAG
jgi:hypothetical protein